MIGATLCASVTLMTAACGGSDGSGGAPGASAFKSPHGSGTSSGTGTSSTTGTTSTTSSTTSSTSTGTQSTMALQIADFILAQQDINGAIPDEAGTDTANTDSDMEYALIGLAAAYGATHDAKYLTGLEKGIAWLAAREEMTDPAWRGSWRYAYSMTPPYAAIATSPGTGIADVRGVDATSALFVYLLYLDRQLTGSTALVTQYGANARAALDFVLAKNINPSGYSGSSWQLPVGSTTWQFWPYEYAADQGDVYLGMNAGALLFPDNPNYAAKAAFLRNNVPSQFYMADAQRYSVGRDTGAPLDADLGIDTIFPQGYLPWVFGSNSQSIGSIQWMTNQTAADGSIRSPSTDPAYALSDVILLLGAPTQGMQAPSTTLPWIVNNVLDPRTHGIHDYPGSPDQETNVSGFAVAALLGMKAFP
ncbi:prenyltransferase-like family protein [Burkholderia thailandensis MSMB121]|nr:prenyltransferase-like family protein [Burkholderia thailandensis MSMB121]AJY44224.1 prenyltransferase-like family protein [Burkholderia sp. 2002721687]